MKTVYEEISNAEYRKRDGISASDLKKMMKSMATWKYSKENPEEGDTPAFKFGRAYHKFCLEPYDFDNEWIVSPKFDRRTKEGKEAAAKFEKDAEGKEVIDEETYQILVEMREALYKTPYVKKLIYGEHEKSFFWTDAKTGIPCKCRPDSYGEFGSQKIIVDLKTCSDAETSVFMRDAIRFGYDIQAAHYVDGMENISNENYSFVFIAQEKTAPYLVNVLQADDYFMQNGRKVRDSLLETYMKCIELDEWPGLMGFAEDKTYIQSLSVPEWIKNALESESESESEV